MTPKMRQLIDRLQGLPEREQDVFAAFCLNELEEDERWVRTTERHADKLTQLTDQVITDDARGLCEPLDPDSL